MRIDYNQLKLQCLRPIKEFKAYGDVTKTRDGIFISKANPDNKILAVCHLDSVLGLKHFYVNRIANNDYVFNAQLDDRLGAYIILDLLPGMGLNYDILLTEGEEQGRSTAVHFESLKRYNWIFSFDRRGNDVVMYDYEDIESTDLLKQYKFRPDFGSFSDICFLEHLNCKGFNFGTGYYGEHSELCYMDSQVTLNQVNKFIKFFRACKDLYMPHVIKPVKYSGIGKFNRSYMSASKNESEYDFCEICGHKIAGQDLVYGICEACSVQFKIECQHCHKRISMDDYQDYGLCESCDGDK